MPTIRPGKTTNPIDANALTPARMRRNFQRMAMGATNALIVVQPPITNGPGGLGLALEPDGGLVVVGGALGVLLDPNGAISAGMNGLAVKVDGTTIQIIGDQLVATTGGSPLTTKGDLFTFTTVDARLPVGSNGQFLQAQSGQTTGLEWVGGNSDTSLISSSTGLAVNPATGGALSVSSGLLVNVDGVTITINGSNELVAAVGTGTVTSVALTVPTSIFTVSGSPITTAGTLAITETTQNANLVWAGPATGSAATPTFRALVSADIPSLSGLYLPLAGGTMSGDINFNGHTATNINAITFGVQNTTQGVVTIAGAATGTTGGELILNSVGNVGTLNCRFGNGTWGVDRPVPYFRSQDTNKGVAFDLSSNGTAQDCWIDVCSTDITADQFNFECITLRHNAGTYGSVGTKGSGSGVVRPLAINEVGGNVSIGTSASFPNTLFVEAGSASLGGITLHGTSNYAITMTDGTNTAFFAQATSLAAFAPTAVAGDIILRTASGKHFLVTADGGTTTDFAVSSTGTSDPPLTSDASTLAGEMWYDTTNARFRELIITDGTNKMYATPVACWDSVTANQVMNTTTGGPAVFTNPNVTIPSGFFNRTNPGRVLRITIGLTFAPGLLNSQTFYILTGGGGFASYSGVGSSQTAKIVCEISASTTGGSGTLQYVQQIATTAGTFFLQTGTGTFNLTMPIAITFAGNSTVATTGTITLLYYTLEVLN